MIENFETIKHKVLLLTGLDETPQNVFNIKVAIDEILSYCNRVDVPTEMENLVIDIIFKKLTDADSDKVIQSYSEGNMSVSYKVSESTDKYNGRLNSFKLITGV